MKDKESFLKIRRLSILHQTDRLPKLLETLIKWGGKYKYAVQSWQNNWEDLTVFFEFPVEIRTTIYTTNLIENLNGKIKNTLKINSFPTDEAVINLFSGLTRVY